MEIVTIWVAKTLQWNISNNSIKTIILVKTVWILSFFNFYETLINHQYSDKKVIQWFTSNKNIFNYLENIDLTETLNIVTVLPVNAHSRSENFLNDSFITLGLITVYHLEG